MSGCGFSSKVRNSWFGATLTLACVSWKKTVSQNTHPFKCFAVLLTPNKKIVGELKIILWLSRTYVLIPYVERFNRYAKTDYFLLSSSSTSFFGRANGGTDMILWEKNLFPRLSSHQTLEVHSTTVVLWQHESADMQKQVGDAIISMMMMILINQKNGDSIKVKSPWTQTCL